MSLELRSSALAPVPPTEATDFRVDIGTKIFWEIKKKSKGDLNKTIFKFRQFITISDGKLLNMFSLGYCASGTTG